MAFSVSFGSLWLSYYLSSQEILAGNLETGQKSVCGTDAIPGTSVRARSGMK